jgi:hypothetical protein
MQKKRPVVNRRDFLKKSAVLIAGTATLAGQERAEPRLAKIHFDRAADVVIVGAG